MSEQYSGWNLFDKVIIVAKPIMDWDYETRTYKPNGSFQGYIVDPKNKTMLNHARRWGEWIEYTSRGDLRTSITHKPEEYFYDNDGFTLSLCDAADSSSQGGKLSFWNCNITAPDGQVFLVGIAANLLLDVLKNNTIINGVVQTPLCFARQKGQVGMLSKNMESYQLALRDMQTKEKVSTNKTKNHIIGHVYETVTLKNIYLGKIYNWYEPIIETVNNNSRFNTSSCFRGLRKREKPDEMYLFPDYCKERNKLSEYVTDRHSRNFQDKIPARKEAEEIIELDILIQEYLNLNAQQNLERLITDNNRYMHAYYIQEYAGYSDNPESYIIPDNIREIILRAGYIIED